MKREEFERALEKYAELLIEQSLPHIKKGEEKKGSTASPHKYIEVITRAMIYISGLTSVKDVRVRPTSKPDAKTKRFGIVEVKCGSGAVVYGSNLTLENVDACDIYPDKDTVMWSPWMEWSKGLDYYEVRKWQTGILKNMYVFNRYEFVTCLETIGKNGLQSSLKVSKTGNQLNIQTISSKLERRLFDFLEENNIPLLGDIL